MSSLTELTCFISPVANVQTKSSNTASSANVSRVANQASSFSSFDCLYSETAQCIDLTQSEKHLRKYKHGLFTCKSENSEQNHNKVGFTSPKYEARTSLFFFGSSQVVFSLLKASCRRTRMLHVAAYCTGVCNIILDIKPISSKCLPLSHAYQCHSTELPSCSQVIHI